MLKYLVVGSPRVLSDGLKVDLDLLAEWTIHEAFYLLAKAISDGDLSIQVQALWSEGDQLVE